MQCGCPWVAMQYTYVSLHEKSWVDSYEVWGTYGTMRPARVRTVQFTVSGHTITSETDWIVLSSALLPTRPLQSVLVTFLLTPTRYLTKQFKGRRTYLSLCSLP